MAKAQFTKQMTVAEFEVLFPDDDACKSYLQGRRWPVVVSCPRCGNEKVAPVSGRAFNWQCRACSPAGYRFSVLVGTIFENTNVGLRTWFKVIHLMLVSKKGIAALQVQRIFGFGSYETAHYMCMRIRAGLVDPQFRQLMGIVEVDETYIGGKDKNKHVDKRSGVRGPSGKQPIVGAVERNGQVVARVVAHTDAATLHGFIREAVSTKVDLLATDDYRGYLGLKGYKHASVRHSAGEYVVGAVHAQTIDSFWSLIKRGIMGTFHKVSAKYLPLYVAEFEFRYNNRNTADIFGAAVARC